MINKIKQFLFPKQEDFKYNVLTVEEPNRKVEVMKKTTKKAAAPKKKAPVKKTAPKKTTPAKKTAPKKTTTKKK